VSRSNTKRSSDSNLLAVVPSTPRARSLSPYRIPIYSSTNFKYQPLDADEKRAIRIIRVHPDLQDGFIYCEIEHSTTRATYSALSYTWGSVSDETETVLIDGYAFSVRRNLYDFLRYVRKNHARKPLWIDAICINQSDIEEKNIQVKMMARIYTSTKEVLVWLGQREEYVGHAFRRMEAYENMGDTEMALSSSNDEDFWKGFKAINRASYWDRVWVLQEFIQPQKGRIIQGDRWVSFETFQNTVKRFEGQIYRLVLKYWAFGPRRNEDFSEYMSNIHPLWQRRMDRAKHASANSPPAPDAEWALLSGSRYCQDLRDRVYGIMPLATHGPTLKVNYLLNPFEVLLESIWLEHDSEMDRTDVLMNLANILMLTPASICMYAQRVRKSRADRLMRKLPPDREAQRIHLRAAENDARADAWLDVASSDGREVKWKNFTDQRMKMPKRLHNFPSRRQCSWNMFVYTTINSTTYGLKMAIDSRNVPNEKGRLVDDVRDERDVMTQSEFLEVNTQLKGSLALGVYRTKCAPYEMAIYYALMDGLQDVGRGGNTSAFWGEGLESLGELDIDL
jgi:hypothetical protein